MNADLIIASFNIHDVVKLVSFMAILLIMAPSASFLYFGWRQRQKEILSGINSKENKAIIYFFAQFHPNFEADENDQLVRFRKYYDTEFGRLHFIIPFAVLLLISTLLLNICSGWLTANSFILNDRIKSVGLFSVMGAYLWILNDQILKWWHADLSPCDLYRASFRFLVSVPLGYAVSGFLADNVAPFVAFSLGTFPTDTLFKIVRRLSKQRLGLKEASEGKESELQYLRGIDARTAERFATEGITTISQLAYCDPIKITIRTNLGYSYIVDCVSQALLWIYTEKDHEIWRKAGLRSAFEITNLYDDMESGSREEKKDASALIKLLAKQLKTEEIAIKNTVKEVAQDPYSKFIYETWVTDL